MDKRTNDESMYRASIASRGKNWRLSLQPFRGNDHERQNWKWVTWPRPPPL